MPKSKARFALTPALLLSLVACGQQKLPDFSAHPGGQAVGGATTETTQPASTAPSQVAAQTVPGTSFAQRVFDLTNAARTQARTCGTTAYAAAPALTYNSLLERAAQDHAADMASKNYFSHTSLDGRKFSQRITNAGYGWRTAGGKHRRRVRHPRSPGAGLAAKPRPLRQHHEPGFQGNRRGLQLRRRKQLRALLGAGLRRGLVKTAKERERRRTGLTLPLFLWLRTAAPPVFPRYEPERPYGLGRRCGCRPWCPAASRARPVGRPRPRCLASRNSR